MAVIVQVWLVEQVAEVENVVLRVDEAVAELSGHASNFVQEASDEHEFAL